MRFRYTIRELRNREVSDWDWRVVNEARKRVIMKRWLARRGFRSSALFRMNITELQYFIEREQDVRRPD